MTLTDNFDRLFKEKLPENPAEENRKSNEHYRTPSSARYLCVIEPDGRRTFFSYIDLKGGLLSPDETTIDLNFFGTRVKFIGRNLAKLFEALLGQTIKSLHIAEQRFIALESADGSVVTKMIIVYDQEGIFE